jgi:hypothetical protein
MDKIKDLQKKNIDNIIKIAANSAMEKLKKYYSYTDALVYTVSTGKFTLYDLCDLFIYLFFHFFILV